MIKFKDILKEEKILVPRNLEDRDEKYKRIIYQKIQDYIKQGSKGLLNLEKSPIINLPDNLIEVRGNLYLGESQIQSLNNLQIVKGYLNLWGSQIESLGNLQIVGGFLNLGNTLIQSLGNLKKVERYLSLKNTLLSKKYSRKEILQMLKDKGIKVKGKIYI